MVLQQLVAYIISCRSERDRGRKKEVEGRKRRGGEKGRGRGGRETEEGRWRERGKQEEKDGGTNEQREEGG